MALYIGRVCCWIPKLEANASRYRTESEPGSTFRAFHSIHMRSVSSTGTHNTLSEEKVAFRRDRAEKSSLSRRQ